MAYGLTFIYIRRLSQEYLLVDCNIQSLLLSEKMSEYVLFYYYPFKLEIFHLQQFIGQDPEMHVRNELSNFNIQSSEEVYRYILIKPSAEIDKNFKHNHYSELVVLRVCQGLQHPIFLSH